MWKQLTWLERVWVLNVVFPLLGSAGVIAYTSHVANGYTGPHKPDWVWVLIVLQAAALIIAVISIMVLGDRLFTGGVQRRAISALQTRGLRTWRKQQAPYIVAAYPMGSEVVLTILEAHWRPRPWPLMLPVKLRVDHGDRQAIRAENQQALLKSWASFSDQARAKNRDYVRRQQLHKLADQTAARINSQS